MKRFLLVFCYIASLFFIGCQQSDTPPVLRSDFDAVVTVRNIETEIEDFSLTAKLSVRNKSSVDITLISPEELNGLSYIWDDGFEMAYLDLHCKTEGDYLPRFSFAQGIYNVLTSLESNSKASKTQNKLWLFEGKSESGDYRILADNEGYIKNISVEEINLSVDFEYEE